MASSPLEINAGGLLVGAQMRQREDTWLLLLRSTAAAVVYLDGSLGVGIVDRQLGNASLKLSKLA